MTASRFAACLIFAALPWQTAVASSEDATPTLDALAKRMASARDYTVTIDAHEIDGDRTDDRTMRFSFLAPDHAKLEVIKGSASGTRLIWNGGQKVHVRGGVFSIVPLWLDLNDPRITSMRGNTMLRAEFAPALACFVAHRTDVRESPGPEVAGEKTVLVALTIPGGLHCPADSEKDHDVTKDVLTVVPSKSTVVERRRYVGDTLVERWILSDLKFDSGLTDGDFR